MHVLTLIRDTRKRGSGARLWLTDSALRSRGLDIVARKVLYL